MKLAAPKNNFVAAAKIVLEKLIEGAAVDIAIAEATAYAPFLAFPIIKQLFSFAVGKLAAYIDENMFKVAAKLIIRIQGDSRKEAFNESMKPFINGVPSDEDLKRAKEAIDRLVNRSRP